MEKFVGMYDIRDGKTEDHNFVIATFLKGLYNGDSWFSLIPHDIFMAYYRKIVTAILASPQVNIKVACLKDAPDVIIGYSILSLDYQTIHFVYVKKSWREGGVGRSLVPQRPTTITHLTDLGRKLMTKFDSVIFNPF